MGGIQSISALPDDPTFDQFNNKYDVASYKRICNDFRVDLSSDFRFKRGANHGLGSVYVYASYIGPVACSRRSDPGGFEANKPVDRGIRLLCFGFTGERKKQHTWIRRACKGSTK